MRQTISISAISFVQDLRRILARRVGIRRRGASLSSTLRRRLLVSLLLLVPAVAATVEAGEVGRRVALKASPDASRRMAILRHEIVLEPQKGTASVKSFDRAGRVTAELIATQQTTTLRRYLVQSGRLKPVDEVVVDDKGNQVSFTTINEQAFLSWGRTYLDELAKRTVSKTAPVKKSPAKVGPATTSAPRIVTRGAGVSEDVADDCIGDCGNSTAKCAFWAGPSVFGWLVCFGKYFVCSMGCPPDFGESMGGTGSGYSSSAPGQPQCGLRKCKPDQQCCPVDNICLSRTQRCP